MKRYTKHLAACTVRRVECPEHGEYDAGILMIGEIEYPSRCPACRADDAALEASRLKEDAVEVLTNLGRASMARQRKRRDTDREFYVRLDNTASKISRIAVGLFWASSELEAIEIAKREYPGLFLRLETQTWTAHAEPTGKLGPIEAARSVVG